MADGADGTVAHHGGGLLQRADVAIGKVHHVDDARRRGSSGHRIGIRRIGGQRLFAQDMLARRQNRHGGGKMRGIGGDVGHRVELTPGQGLGE